MWKFQSLKQGHTQSVFHTFMSVFTLRTRYLDTPFASPSLRHYTYCKLCTPVHTTAVPSLSIAMLSRAEKRGSPGPTRRVRCTVWTNYRGGVQNEWSTATYIFRGTFQADSPVYPILVDQYQHLYVIKSQAEPECRSVYTCIQGAHKHPTHEWPVNSSSSSTYRII